jgi:hypothetical protein
MKCRMRPTKAEIRQLRKVRKAKARQYREQLKQSGYLLPTRAPQSNGVSRYESISEEEQDRQVTTTAMLSQVRNYLRVLLERLDRIVDPRNPKKVKYSLPLVLAYGLMMFIFQMTSRREANREMTRPQFLANLKLFIPEFEALPHHDTVQRLLESMTVEEIEAGQVAVIQWLIDRKKFRRHLFNTTYVVAIDGTQKLTSECLWDTNWQTRTRDGEVIHRYVYVVEASLVLSHGVVVPLMSEFLTPEEASAVEGASDEKTKQDCELNAGRRLMMRIKERFPRLRVLVTLDGLYANGPMMRFVRGLSWDYMIVLKDGSLRDVWADFDGLRKIERDHVHQVKWRDRCQTYHWSNDIDHDFRIEGRPHSQKSHVVVCEESWGEIDQAGTLVTRTARFAWLSECPLTRDNVAVRCNDGGRRRWGIETEFLIEKRRGYSYEHAFSYFAQAMKGYHYLMRIALLINTLIRHSALFARQVKDLGHQGLIKFVRETLSGPWFMGHEAEALKAMEKPARMSFG